MSVFSDQRIIDFIGTNFIPVATDINKSVHRRDEDGDFFRKIAEQGHYAGRTKPTNTRQGLYVALADGQLLASINSNSADSVLAMMREAVVNLKKTRTAGSPDFKHPFTPDRRYAFPFPADGMILRVTCRDFPRPKDPKHETWRHNFDNVWLTKKEKRSLAPPEPKTAKVGDRYKIPSTVVARIAKFHLIDHVRGEAPAWQPESVRIAGAKAKVVGVSRNSLNLQLTGRVKVVESLNRGTNSANGAAGDSELGVDLRLAGKMKWSIDRETFTAFDWLAYGDRWGTAPYNFRHDDLENNPFGITLNLLPTIPANMTEPKYLSHYYFK